MIVKIRTDLDSFSEAEACVLENHGYMLANAAIQRHVPDLVPAKVPEMNIPYSDWMDEEKVKTALKDSGRRTLLGHGQSLGI